jgi:hypothetical protein
MYPTKLFALLKSILKNYLKQSILYVFLNGVIMPRSKNPKQTEAGAVPAATPSAAQFPSIEEVERQVQNVETRIGTRRRNPRSQSRVAQPAVETVVDTQLEAVAEAAVLVGAQPAVDAAQLEAVFNAAVDTQPGAAVETAVVDTQPAAVETGVETPPARLTEKAQERLKQESQRFAEHRKQLQLNRERANRVEITKALQAYIDKVNAMGDQHGFMFASASRQLNRNVTKEVAAELVELLNKARTYQETARFLSKEYVEFLRRAVIDRQGLRTDPNFVDRKISSTTFNDALALGRELFPELKSDAFDLKKDKIMLALQTYLARVTSHEASYGFVFFAESRGLSRKVNIAFAKELTGKLDMAMDGHAVAQLFTVEALKKMRDGFASMEPGFKDCGMNSAELNAAFKLARELFPGGEAPALGAQSSTGLVKQLAQTLPPRTPSSNAVAWMQLMAQAEPEDTTSEVERRTPTRR